MDIETVRSHGFVTVEYPSQLRTSVVAAMESWKKFCELPDHEKSKFSGGDRRTDFGYMLRNDKGPNADHKEQFHVLRLNIEEMKRISDEIRDSRATLFIDAIDSLITEISPLIQNFAQKVEQYYGLAGFEKEVMNSQDHWVFRYLHYFGSETLAHEHADRGGFTLHTNESDEGGQYLDFSGNWIPWPVNEKQTIIFPGMGLQHRSDSELKALWHRVKPTPASLLQGRYAMVTFIDFQIDWKWDPAQRIQDMSPGFNYDLLNEEFKKFFVRR